MIAVNIKITGMNAVRGALNKVSVQAPVIIHRIVGREALEFAAKVQKGIRNQAPGGQPLLPLADSTKKMKKSSKALIDKGDLVRSVKAQDVSGDLKEKGATGWFVGVHRKTYSDKGKEMVNIAEVHEFGTKPFKIKVTTKMRRFFMAMVIAGKMRAPIPPSKTVINHPGVPARPFIRPTFVEWQVGDGEGRIAREVAHALGLR